MFSPDQSKFIVTSDKDILYVDMSERDKDRREIDFDDKEGIDSIKNILATKDHFFVLANKRNHRLGFYLFSIDIKNPHNDSKYFIKWNNKLDINDCDMQQMIETRNNETHEYIVVSYKCIGINTYNVFVFDLCSQLIKYWYEGYQLWESPVKGFMLSTNDFLILSKDGINVIALGEKKSRIITDMEGQ